MVTVDHFVPYQQTFVIVLGLISAIYIFMKISLLHSSLFKRRSFDQQQSQKHNNNNVKSTKFGVYLIQIVSFTSIFLFSASTYMTLLSIIYDFEGLNRGSGILYIFAEYLMLFSFVLRIHITFRGSIMEYSYSIIILLYIACLLCILLLSLIAICFYFSINILFLGILMTIWLIIYISFVFCVMVLFVRKIEKCMMTVFRQNLSDVCQGTKSIKKDELLDINIINSIIKYSLLVMISIITSFWTYIICVAFYFQFHDTPLKNISFTIAMIDGLISSICLFLFYPQNNKIYKILCHYGHRFLYKGKLYQILYCLDLTTKEKDQFREIMM